MNLYVVIPAALSIVTSLIALVTDKEIQEMSMIVSWASLFTALLFMLVDATALRLG